MNIDFKKIKVGASGGIIIEPRKIFTTLKREKRFRRPSDEQGEVLDLWYNQRGRGFNTIKMNTGAGKTLVGLLALKSSLNEGINPAVYITADNYLSEQVLKEASDLGISATNHTDDGAFLAGKSILVANIWKLFNGQSVFGVGAEGVKISIGALVVDDAHACLATLEDQFNLRLDSTSPAYDKLFALFRPSLEQQSISGVLELESNDPRTVIEVPFWNWKDNQAEIARILHTVRDSDNLKFSWPLVKDVLPLCRCAIGGGKLEISPRCLPIDVIPAFTRAKRKIVMTATLADDGILITHFNADPGSVTSPIRPRGVGTMGDRLILVPQEINPSITQEDIKSLAQEVATTRNVAVIVPSSRRAQFWEDISSQTLDRTNIGEGVRKLKRERHVGLTVFVNKYDGIDLPGPACELLIIDGLPDVYGLIDRIDMMALDGTEFQLLRQIQRIEQGMGRGIRSSEDHCVVLLMGNRLTQRLHPNAARNKFTPATLAQIDLGREITEQIQGQPISELRPILDYCFDNNSDWQSASRTALVNAQEGPLSYIRPSIVNTREAFDLARKNQWDEACSVIQSAANEEHDDLSKGYLLQQLAEYTHHSNPRKAQEILLRATSLNSRILKPIAGITYTKIQVPVVAQSANISRHFEKYATPNDFIIAINPILEELIWDPEGTRRFERAVQELGILLGFHSQRPENEFGSGPDNLWSIGKSRYLVIECKNGATSDTISKPDCNQLGGSMRWFNSYYDSSQKPTPIIIHPSSKVSRRTTPPADMRVIDNKHLEKLLKAVRAFTSAITTNTWPPDEADIAKQLEYFHLTEAKFVITYSTKFTFVA